MQETQTQAGPEGHDPEGVTPAAAAEPPVEVPDLFRTPSSRFYANLSDQWDPITDE